MVGGAMKAKYGELEARGVRNWVPERRVSVQRYSNESRAGVGGEIGFGFGNDEATQRITCEASWKTPLFYH